MQVIHSKKLIVAIIIILCVPLLGFFVIFDLTTPAYKFDEEYNGSLRVAIGPRPRYFFCSPTYDIHYDGREWPFFVFKHMCFLWRKLAGYASPRHGLSAVINGSREGHL